MGSLRETEGEKGAQDLFASISEQGGRSARQSVRKPAALGGTGLAATDSSSIPRSELCSSLLGSCLKPALRLLAVRLHLKTVFLSHFVDAASVSFVILGGGREMCN